MFFISATDYAEDFGPRRSLVRSPFVLLVNKESRAWQGMASGMWDWVGEWWTS
jgi:tripartite-type tricarboxylate transporter receptor subunit TctC